MKEADKDVRAPVAPRFANSQSTQPPFLARSPACTSMLTPSLNMIANFSPCDNSSTTPADDG